MAYSGDRGEDPTGEPGTRQRGGGGGAGGDSGLNVYGCTGDQVKINIDSNGRQGAEECVDQAEAQRRNKLWVAQNPGPTGEKPTGTDGPVGSSGPTPAGRPNYGPAPVFNAPVFSWGEQWQAPSIQDALNDPGYQFRQNEGLRALQQSAAAKGVLGSGGTLKDINAWGQNFAKQEYGDVFNRALTGYNTRFGTAKDIFDRYYTGKKDEFAPKLFEWQTNAHGADLGWQQAWLNYWKDHLSAQDIWNKPA